MLKLSLPTEAGLFQPLVDHPKVLRVVALSGGFARPEACVELAKNPGIIASFSRALLEDLRHQMNDDEFNASLGGAINEIHARSEEHTSELQSLMRISYAVFCLQIKIYTHIFALILSSFLFFFFYHF